jgi:alanyl-tRNA synthetase
VDTKNIEGIVVHECFIKLGNFKVGDNVLLEIDYKRRLACSKNHTATHILQAALKNILGSHVAQKGSLVTNEKLRFDFIHNETITEEDIRRIEDVVINAIESSLEVQTQILPIEEARKSGAIALFGEKYRETVRVVTIGNNFSKEFCGGVHVNNTGQIGCFKIISVSSIGSGIKRVEAVTSSALRKYLENEIFRHLEKINLQGDMIKKLEKHVSELQINNFAANINLVTEKIGSVTFKHAVVCDAERSAIFTVIDNCKKSVNAECLVIGNKNSKSEKVTVCLFVSSSLILKFDVKDVLEYWNTFSDVNVKSGDRKDLAQFGGFNTNNFEQFLESVRTFIKSKSI